MKFVTKLIDSIEMVEMVEMVDIFAQVLNFCPQNQTFMFDHVIDGSNQNDVFDLLVKPLVDKAFEGYDCTFIATGQSGSGKTYTMGFENSVSKENLDVNQLIMHTNDI